MVVLKVLSLIAAAVLSFLTVHLMLRDMQAKAVRVKAAAPRHRQPQARRLRQDPRTGVYYPEA